jgi:4-coumarate--CoA ligase
MGKFDLLTALEHVQQYRITELWLVPPMAVALAKHPAVSKYDLSSVEFIFCGAAPLGQDVCLQVEKRFDGRVNVKQGWGMTEYVKIVLNFKRMS